MEQDLIEAKKYLSEQGYGSGTNYTTNLVAVLLANYSTRVVNKITSNTILVGESEQFICPCCGSDRTYKTEAYHCNRCAVTTEV